jgi:hypothetical protein
MKLPNLARLYYLMHRINPIKIGSLNLCSFCRTLGKGVEWE